MSWLNRLACVSAFVTGAGVGCLQSAEAELALGVRTTDPRTPQEQRLQFRLPPGFEIQLVAAEPDIHKPMNLAFDALGRLWVTTSIEYPFAAPADRPARDRLMIFEDFGPDGRARKVTEFAGGLNIPIGVHPFRSPGKDGRPTWKALVWSIPNIWLLEDTDGDGKADRREAVYGPFDHTRDTHGNQASFRRGFDGWLYATHGFNNDSHVTSRDGNRVDLNSGNTYRIRLDGSRIEHHTWGQVNPFGLTWDPRGNLYSSDCHSAPLYQLLAGGYYPSFGKPHDGLGFAPTLMEHAHGSTAIDGACYYADDLWPAAFRDNLFVGNVMTSRLNRDRIEFDGSSPRAIELPDFLTSEDPWFRPVDTCLAPDGALYVADFYNRIIGHYEVPLLHPGRDRERGRLWRIVATDEAGKARLRPAALAATTEGLVAELASPSLARRLLAMEELQDRVGTAAIPGLRQAWSSPANPEQAVHALWMLQRLGVLSADELQAAATHREALVRIHAQRIGADVLHRVRLGEAVPGTLREVALGNALPALDDVDPLARRCAAETLGTAPRIEHVRPLLQALDRVPRADTHHTYVLRKSVRDHLRDPDVMKSVLAETGWDKARLRHLASAAIAVGTAPAAAFLLREFPRYAGPDGPSAAEVLRHAARHAPEDQLPALVTLARTVHAGDPGAQLDLFKSVQQGLEQRGLALPAALRDWGNDVVRGQWSDTGSGAGWNNVPLDETRPANPWDLQERPFADGTRGLVLSSIPHGESLTGILRSKPFAAPARFEFWMCGHDGYPDKPASRLNFARLVDARTGEELARSWPPRNDEARRQEWDLAAHAGRQVVFEAVDGDTGAAYAWLAVARFTPGTVELPRVGLRGAVNRSVAAADLAIVLGLADLEPKLRAAARDAGMNPEVRLAGARAALALGGGAAASDLSALLTTEGQGASFIEPLGEMLAGVKDPAVQERVFARLKVVPHRVQVRWVQAMAASAEGAAAVLSAAERGNVPARLVQVPAIRTRLTNARLPDVEGRMARLTRDLPAADVARDQLISKRREAWNRAGGAARVSEGERLFQAQCAACHQLGGKGGLVGPQLTGIGNRGAERLCEDILDPNRNVDHAFRQTLVTLKSGDTIAGLFRRQEGAQLILATPAGTEVTVASADVAERRESDLSLMPDNFGDALAEGEFVDLLAYLLAQRGR